MNSVKVNAKIQTFCEKNNLIDNEWCKNGMVPDELDFQQSADWLWTVYHDLRTRDMGLPKFVACYTPREMTMLLVAEHPASELFVYRFEWGERGCYFTSMEMLYTEPA